MFSLPKEPKSAQLLYYNGPVAQMPTLVTDFVEHHPRQPSQELSLSSPLVPDRRNARPPSRALDTSARFARMGTGASHMALPTTASPPRLPSFSSLRRARKRRVENTIAAELGHIRAALGRLDHPPALPIAWHHRYAAPPSAPDHLPRSSADYDSLLRIASSAGGPPPALYAPPPWFRPGQLWRLPSPPPFTIALSSAPLPPLAKGPGGLSAVP
jgi:hypothetical protein